MSIYTTCGRCGQHHDTTVCPTKGSGPPPRPRRHNCEGGDHMIGDRVGCEECTLHTIQAATYWEDKRNVLRLYVASVLAKEES